MKACVLHAVGDLRVEEVPDPRPGAGEVLLKIKACGICGSDIHRVLTDGTYSFPTIPGHEFAGQIVELGEGVDANLLGRKAAVFPLLPCGKCECCQIGQYAQCTSYDYFGSRRDGGFAEYLSVPVWNLVLVPDSFTYEEAAMCEPACVALHGLRQVGVDIGDNVAVFGAGPIGIMTALFAKAWGADKIMLIDIDDEKLNFAKKLGFDLAFNNRSADASAWVKGETGGQGADVCIESAGVSATLDLCLLSAKPFSRILALGSTVTEMRISAKAYGALIRKQLKICGTWNSFYANLPRNEWKLVVREIETGKIDLKPLVTHRFPLEAGVKPIRMMHDRKEFFNKVMFINDK
jgi:L-iditol 2-dehydrogenase